VRRRAFLAGAICSLAPGWASAFVDPHPASDLDSGGPTMGNGSVWLFASHTSEELRICFRTPWGEPLPEGYSKLCWLLRDFHRDGEAALRPMRDTVIAQMMDGLDFIPAAAADERHFVDSSKLDFGRVPWSDSVKAIDIRLLDLLSGIQLRMGGKRITILSAYRSAQTNERLKEAGGHPAIASQHLRGMAADCQPPIPLGEFHALALSLRAGGVGWYPGNGFVHVDVGAVRSWSG